MNSKYHPFLVSLLAACAGLAMSSCSRTADQSAQRQRDSVAALLDAYVNGYKTGDWAKVRFAADVTFEGSLTNGKIVSKPALQKLLSNARAKDVRVKRRIIDGQFACVLADFKQKEQWCRFVSSFTLETGKLQRFGPTLILVL